MIQTHEITIGRAAGHLARMQGYFNFYGIQAAHYGYFAHDRVRGTSPQMAQAAQECAANAQQAVNFLDGAQQLFSRVAAATPPANDAFFCQER